nr:hypothetical protein [Tanacetum cinerariifolium]GEY68544.1 hypothetical protein [Tanacetum cinerariifolium]
MYVVFFVQCRYEGRSDITDDVRAMVVHNGDVLLVKPACSDKGQVVVETDDPFDDHDEILGEYANIKNEIKVYIGNSSTVKNMVDYDMLYEIEEVVPMKNFNEVEVDMDNKTKEESAESDTKENDTSDSDSEDLDYDPKHDEVFGDDEHILEDVPVSINNFNFNLDPKHDLSIVDVEVHENHFDVIDYESFGSDLDDRIASDTRTPLIELRRICKAKNQDPKKYYFYLGQQFATK